MVRARLVERRKRILAELRIIEIQDRQFEIADLLHVNPVRLFHLSRPRDFAFEQRDVKS